MSRWYCFSFLDPENRILLNKDIVSQSHNVAYAAGTFTRWLILPALCFIAVSNFILLLFERIFAFSFCTEHHRSHSQPVYWPPWSIEISVWIHVTQWIWYNGDLEISQNSSFCVVLFIPQGQGDIKYSLPLNAFVDLTLDFLMAILLFENENT